MTTNGPTDDNSTTATPQPTRQRVTRYEVSLLPEDHPYAGYYSLTVEYRGTGRWAVCRHGYCLDIDGHLEYEGIVSNRTDGWLDAHQFPLHEALALAHRFAPDINVGGVTARQAYGDGTS